MDNKLQILVGLKLDATQALKDLNIQLKMIQQRMREITAVNGDNALGVNGLAKANKNLTNSFKETKKEATGLRGTMQKLTADLKHAFGKFLQWTAIAVLISTVKVGFQQAYEVVRDVDSAFVQLAITTGATSEQIKQVDGDIEELTEKVGRLKVEIINAVTEFARAGYTLEDSITLAENAIVGANVGLTELTKTSSVIIAAMKSFNLEVEESARVIDVLFNVSRNAAINFEGIGEAFLRSANSLKVAGATLEEGAALIAAANESIQDPSKVGTALKTISARLRGLDAENNVPKLQKALRAVGIEIQDQEGNFRDVFSIFKDLSLIFDDLDDLTKQNIIEQLAGKRQANILIGLIDNFAEAENALEDGLNSAGTAAQENEKHLESIEGRVVLLKEATNELLESIVSSDAVKMIVTGLTEIVKLLEFIIQASPAIMIIGGATFAIVKLGLAITVASKLATAGVTSFAISLSLLNPVLIGVGVVVAGLALAFKDNTKAEMEKIKTTERHIKIQNELNRVIREGTEAEKEALEAEIRDLLSAKRKLLRDLEDAHKATATGLGGFGGLGAIANIYAEIKTLDDALADYGVTADNVNDVLDGLTDTTDDFVESLSKLKMAQQDLKEDVDAFYLVRDALRQMTDEGYLADDMILALQGSFPDFAETTKLESGEIVKYLQDMINGYDTVLNTNIENTEANIDLAKARIGVLMAEKRVIESLTSDTRGGVAVPLDVLSDMQNETKALMSDINEYELLLNKIKGARIKINKTKKDDLETDKDKNEFLSEQEKLYNSINHQISLLEEELNRAEGEDRIAIIKEIVGLYEDLDGSIDELVKSLSEQNLTQDELTEATRDYRLEQEKGITTIFRYGKEIDKLTEEILGKLVDVYDKKLSDAISKTIDLLREQKEEVAKSYDISIKNKEDEIEALEKQNDLIEKRIRLEELLQNLENLRQEKSNILNERNTRIIRNADVGFEFVANPDEVERINSEIAQAEKDLLDYEREATYNNQLQKLQDERNYLEEQKQQEMDSYDDRIDLLTSYQDDIENVMDDGGIIQASIINNIQTVLKESELEGYSDRLNNLKDFVNNYNKSVSMLNNVAGAGSMTDTSGGFQPLAKQTPPSALTQPSGTSLSRELFTGGAISNIDKRILIESMTVRAENPEQWIDSLNTIISTQ